MTEERVGYNAPLSDAAGGRLALVSDLGDAWVARLASGQTTRHFAEPPLGHAQRIGHALLRPTPDRKSVLLARRVGGIALRPGPEARNLHAPPGL
jgi:hypothetical protein